MQGSRGLRPFEESGQRSARSVVGDSEQRSAGSLVGGFESEGLATRHETHNRELLADKAASFPKIVSGGIVKSSNDHRDYRLVTLNNSMEVVIIHDHSMSSSAAAVNIHAGSFWDPEDIPGLAHFLEHMLFLGSEKYPEKDQFGKYLADRSGASNAETGSEHTTFYFNIDQARARGISLPPVPFARDGGVWMWSLCTRNILNTLSTYSRISSSVRC